MTQAIDPADPADASVNCFTLDYYENILRLAKEAGYKFQTLQAFWHDGCPARGRFVLRHDLDANPVTLRGVLARERAQGVLSTVFVRVTTNTYNPFDYRTYPILVGARDAGHELGLHSNFVEFGMFHGLDPFAVLGAELDALRAFFGHVNSLACHRDLNYAYNSLPWLERNWDEVRRRFDMDYQAYDTRIMDSIIYVNETAEQKLGWRSWTPEAAITTGRSVCMSTHPHWWYARNPFET